MNGAEQVTSWAAAHINIAGLIAACAVKSVLIGFLAYFMPAVLRARAPIQRALAAELALAGLILLPFVTAIMPSWHVSAGGSLNAAWGNALSVGNRVLQGGDAAGNSDAAISWAGLLVAVWAVGAAAVLVRTIAGVAMTTRIVRRARVTDELSITHLLTKVSDELAVRKAVRLVLSSDVSVPFAWGIRKPIIILPESSQSWSVTKLRMVLLHEMAHIRRRDPAWGLIGCMATALYWFNPLIWFLRSRLVAESEKACDDIVVDMEHDAPAYAEHLLSIARQARGRQAVVPAGAAMARKTELEGRLMAILSDRRRMVSVKRWLSAAAALTTFALVLPLAALQVAAADGVATATPAATETVSDQQPADRVDEKLPGAGDFVVVSEMPEQLKCETPIYPAEAKKANTEGTVWIQALIDKAGKVRKAQVWKSSGSQLLDDAAIKAAFLCEYKPARNEGKPVAVWITYRVEFVLQASDKKE